MSAAKRNLEHESALATIAGLSDRSSLPKDFVGDSGQSQATLKVPAQITIHNTLDEILASARQEQASDVHLTPNNPVIFRKYTFLAPATNETLSRDVLEKMIRAGVPAPSLNQFIKTGDVEFIHVVQGFGRFRVTLMKQREGWDLTARVIPMSAPEFKTIGLSEACRGLTKWAQGLVLIGGPVGCGKTSTLSCLVEMINQERQDHIITIESPVEVVFQQKGCQITQREINTHTLSQANALRAALREDPDIIVVSELRDLDSIQLAVTAAETGHLVLGTMNTNYASQTILTLLDSFPADEQSTIANMISESLRGIICQQLVPRKDGTGVVAAFEVLLNNPAIANMIRERKFQQLPNAITMGRSAGMVLLDNSLKDLVTKDIISLDEARKRVVNLSSLM
jgi:twitching motility protein PilT